MVRIVMCRAGQRFFSFLGHNRYIRPAGRRKLTKKRAKNEKNTPPGTSRQARKAAQENLEK
jgi:hypothetical protein